MELAYESFTLFEKIYWIIAVAGSVILVILLAMTFVGGDLDEVDGDVDTEIEGDTGIEFQFLSLWDSGSKMVDGKNSTSNFISGMYKSVPPLQEMFNMAGMQLPEYLKGKEVEGENTEPKSTNKSNPKKKDGES